MRRRPSVGRPCTCPRGDARRPLTAAGRRRHAHRLTNRQRPHAATWRRGIGSCRRPGVHGRTIPHNTTRDASHEPVGARARPGMTYSTTQHNTAQHSTTQQHSTSTTADVGRPHSCTIDRGPSWGRPAVHVENPAGRLARLLRTTRDTIGNTKNRKRACVHEKHAGANGRGRPLHHYPHN